jgi:hypothetical protein
MSYLKVKASKLQFTCYSSGKGKRDKESTSRFLVNLLKLYTRDSMQDPNHDEKKYIQLKKQTMWLTFPNVAYSWLVFMSFV